MFLLNNENKPLPKPGMRIIKTSIATFFCFVIDFLRGLDQPFYSVIASVVCMQKDIENSWIAAKNRLVGTAIGCIFGMFTLVIINSFPIFEHELIKYALFSFLIIPLLYLIVLIDVPGAASVTCVAFASVTVVYANGDSVFFHALNRFTDTSIGIMVSLFVNVAFSKDSIKRVVNRKEDKNEK